MAQKWLITGGCGFIGTNLIKWLIAQGGHAIRVLDNLSVGNQEDLSAVCPFNEMSADDYSVDGKTLPVPDDNQVQLVVGDIIDENLAKLVANDMDIIIHLAGNTGVLPSVENPRKDCIDNVIGTFNYLEAARYHQIKHFVFASSGAPVGTVMPPIHEELAPHPVSPYGASKLAAEGYCSAYFQSYGVNTVCLRFSNIYGPLSKHKSSVVALFIKQALNQQVCEIYGDGEQTRDFLYIDDLIQAIVLASQIERGGEVFQIASGQETTLNQLIQQLSQTLEQMQGPPLNTHYTAIRRGEVKRNYSDISKAKQVLNWHPRVGLQQGLRNTLAYFL